MYWQRWASPAGNAMKKQSYAQAFRCAFAGLWHGFRYERNMRFHLLAAGIATALGWWVRLDAFEWVLLVLTIAAVFTAELFNTAIEAVVDLLSPEPHPLAKIAKDTAAGAVLITALASVVVGYLLLLRRLGL